MLSDAGLWAVNEIKVSVSNENSATIYYKKYVVNADIYHITIKLGFFEKRKGVTLESKIRSRLEQLKNKLMEDNERIKNFRELENKFK
jgi:hypothetical protein